MLVIFLMAKAPNLRPPNRLWLWVTSQRALNFKLALQVDIRMSKVLLSRSDVPLVLEGSGYARGVN